MITNIALSGVYTVLAGLLAFWPTSPGIPDEFGQSIYTLMTYVSMYSWIVNISALFDALAIVTLFEIAIIAVRAVMWLIGLIRGN